MTVLSQLILQTRSSNVQRDLANCHTLHSRLMKCFGIVGEQARSRLGVLYRVELSGQGARILVQSSAEPDWGELPAGYLAVPPATKPLDTLFDAVEPGRTLRFRLLANPTKRLPVPDGGSEASGKRVDLTQDADRLSWLERKGSQSGFSLATANDDDIPSVEIASAGRVHGRKPGGRPLTFGAVQYDGYLTVEDAERFRHALENGIGSGKAYGFGLLSIAPAQ